MLLFNHHHHYYYYKHHIYVVYLFCLVRLHITHSSSHHHQNSGSHPLTEICLLYKPCQPAPVILLVNPCRLIFLKQHLAHISHKPMSIPCPPNIHILLNSFFRSNIPRVKIRPSGFLFGSAIY